MDVTCDQKLLTRFRNKNLAEIQALKSQVHLDSLEIDSLINIYVKLLVQLGHTATIITRMQFRSIFYHMLDMPDDYLMDRIMAALDTSTVPFVTITVFVKAFSLLLRGTFEERCQYCYAVYDVVGDKAIKRDHLTYLLKRALYMHNVEDIEEATKERCDMLMKIVDVDMDGCISYKDYFETVKARPELMEMFGHCMPEREVVNGFMTTFTHQLNKF